MEKQLLDFSSNILPLLIVIMGLLIIYIVFSLIFKILTNKYVKEKNKEVLKLIEQLKEKGDNSFEELNLMSLTQKIYFGRAEVFNEYFTTGNFNKEKADQYMLERAQVFLKNQVDSMKEEGFKTYERKDLKVKEIILINITDYSTDEEDMAALYLKGSFRGYKNGKKDWLRTNESLILRLEKEGDTWLLKEFHRNIGPGDIKSFQLKSSALM